MLDGVQITTREGAILRANVGQPSAFPDMSDGRYTQNDSGGENRYDVDADWDVLDGGTHWHHLVNTIEPSCAAAMRPYIKLL